MPVLSEIGKHICCIHLFSFVELWFAVNQIKLNVLMHAYVAYRYVSCDDRNKYEGNF